MDRGGRIRGGVRVAGMGVAALLLADVIGLAVHGGPSAQSIRATLAKASAHTLGHGTARLSTTFHFQIDANHIHQTVDSDMEGEGDLPHRLIDLTTISGLSAGVELRVVDGVVYEKLGPTSPRPPGVTTPWVSLPTGIPAGQAVPGLSGGSDPTQTLNQLQSLSDGAITGSEQVGSTEIKGVATTEYRLDLDPARFQAEAQAAAAALGRATGGTVPTMTFHSVAMSVWVDAQGLIRQYRVTQDISTTVAGITARVRGKLTLDYWDFGLPVDIQAPPPSQVTPIRSLTPATSA